MIPDIQPIICEIHKLELGPNDVVVLKFPEENIFNAREIADSVRKAFDIDTRLKNISKLLFIGNVEISVIERPNE